MELRIDPEPQGTRLAHYPLHHDGSYLPVTMFIRHLSYKLNSCALPDKRCPFHGKLPLSGHAGVALFE